MPILFLFRICDKINFKYQIEKELNIKIEKKKLK